MLKLYQAAGGDFAHFARGLLMGGADIIPGVSGGTMALILGIYTRLVTAISHVDAHLLALVARRDLRSAAAYLDLRFLLALGGGIGFGIVSLASLMHHLLESYRSYTMAGLFGLILGSSLLVGRMIRAHGSLAMWQALAWGMGGAAAALAIVMSHAISGQHGQVYTFASGAIAICAMILPGISGAHILLLLGKYTEITGIIKRLPKLEIDTGDLVTITVFAMGCAVGLIAFSKILRWLLAGWYGATMSILCGFMIGSLYKIWPFQRDLTPEVSELKHKEFAHYLPEAVNGEVLACLVIGLLTLAAVLTLDWLVARPPAAEATET